MRVPLARFRAYKPRNTTRVNQFCGLLSPPLFVFKGSRIPYHTIFVNGRETVETYADHLTRNACITVRDKVGSVDSTNFVFWATHFARSLVDLTANGRKIILTFDAYRAHMSLRVLNLFSEHRVIAYALSAYSSSALQPCNVALFDSFKKNTD